MSKVNKVTSLTITTYNIEISRKPDDILQNISMMSREGVDAFCLQEVTYHSTDFIVSKILKRLGENWQAEYFVGPDENISSFGVAIIWNTKKLTLQSTEKMVLPKLRKLLFYEAFFAKMIGFQPQLLVRRVLTATFLLKNKEQLRLTSIHLDVLGGMHHRNEQTLHFLNNLSKKPKVDYEVVCGDFNTLDLLKINKEQQNLQKLFKQYKFYDATSIVPWSQDIFYANFAKDNLLLQKVIKRLRIHVPKKLDYIWCKKLTVLHGERKNYTGSDHFPLVVTVTM